jgi:glycosyltransferase involved in cell wall biosynthesis
LIKCILYQTYTGTIEWIIIDDGTDPIEDLVLHLPFVNYIKIAKQTIGFKRNLSHKMSKGDILVYMDDDDWYPPTRVAHAVSMLQDRPEECAGCSLLHFYVPNRPMVTLGPYHPNHTSAATMAMKRSLLSQCSYDDASTWGEESHFLKEYTVPMIQLDPIQTIVVFPHDHNTVDKMCLFSFTNPYFSISSHTLPDFDMPEDLLSFYTNLSAVLLAYPDGKQKRCAPDTIITFNNVELNKQNVVALLNHQHSTIQQLRAQLAQSY